MDTVVDAYSGSDQFVHQYVSGWRNDGVDLSQLQFAIDDGYLPSGYGVAAVAGYWRHASRFYTGYHLDAYLSWGSHYHSFSGPHGRW